MDAQYLRSILDYDPDTGKFTWRARLARKIRLGDEAGTPSSKNRRRLQIKIAGRNYYAHRLAWLHVHGSWPAEEVDHINGDEADNRISNLRIVSREVNMQNRRRATAGNSTGALGVSLSSVSRPFRARLQVGNKAIWLGRHETVEAAHAAYVRAKRQNHEGCTL